MYQKTRRAQTSIEFVIILAILLLISMFAVSAIHETFDITKSLFSVKSRTIDILTRNDSTMLLTKIDYTTLDANNLQLVLNVKYFEANRDFNLSIDQYSDVIYNLKKYSRFKTIDLNFNYYN
ncbi:MAG: hypothetical protein V1824_01670 [archaeon]